MTTEPAVAARANRAGTLLSGEPLMAALFAGERVFRNGSASPDRVRGAGYELRLAGDLLVVPKTPGDADFRRYPAGARVEEIHLDPGDSALICSEERFCLDFDITCSIGPKFRWAARGLLMLQGVAAHPGYGRVFSDGAWLPKEDERLFLVVANIGPERIVIRRGDPIAYVQFFEVERPEAPKEVHNVGYDQLVHTFLAPAAGGLAYFKNVRDLKAQFESAEAARNEVTRRLETRLAAAETAAERAQNSTNNVVVFGVFLVSATLLGVVLATLIGIVVGLPAKVSNARAILVGVLCVLYALAAVAGIKLVARAVDKASR